MAGEQASTKVKLDGYDGGEAEVYDLTISEWDALVRSTNNEEIRAAILPAIKSWNLKDRAGKDIPVTPEGFMQVSHLAIRSMVRAASNRARGEDDPKDASERSQPSSK